MSAGGRIRIGTSGWNYAHWRGAFYPSNLRPSEWFSRYHGAFDTVEINNTFYQLPETATFDAWRRQAPPDFIYAVKASRYLTHLKKLKPAGPSLGRFLERVRHLGTRLGPILYQLPPRWRPNVKRLEAFCARLPCDLTHVIEFRERAWLDDPVYDTLREHGVNLCVHDLLKRHPRRVTGNAVYIRFHGAGTRYGGSYPGRRLRAWANWIREEAGNGRDVYAYFNNDARAHAVRNALALRRLVRERGSDA